MFDDGKRCAGWRSLVDFGQDVAGPLAALMLADQGADVIHVDPPGVRRILFNSSSSPRFTPQS